MPDSEPRGVTYQQERTTKEFTVTAGNRITSRRTRHIRGDRVRYENDVIYTKGLDVKEKVDKKSLAEQIFEGIEEFEEEQREKQKKEGVQLPDCGWEEPEIPYISLKHYEPFDPKVEIKKVPRFSKKEKELSTEERKTLAAQRKEKREQFREALFTQNLAVMDVIDRLRRTIDKNPDIGEFELRKIAFESWPTTRLGNKDLTMFSTAITKYQKKHQEVEKAYAGYTHPSALFLATFGRMPKGKVEVVKGAMTLLFRCFNEADYVLIHSFHKTHGDESKIEQPAKERAKMSGGAALSTGARIPQLAGTLIAENASSYSSGKESRVQHAQHFLHKGEMAISLSRSGDLRFATKGGRTYLLKVVSRVMGAPMRVIVIDERDEKNLLKKDEAKRSQPIADLIATKADFKFSGWRNREDPEDSQLVTASLTLGDKENGISLVLKGDTVRIFDHSQKGTKVTYKEAVSVPATYKRWSRQLHRHEKQHQYNKLFSPIEDHLGWMQIMTRALSRKTSPDACKAMAVEYARFKRRSMGIDSRARDEILAYVRDGTAPPDILATLRDNPLYDYNKDMAEEIEKIPEGLQEMVVGHKKMVAEKTWNVDPSDIDQMKKLEIYSGVFTKEYMAPFVDRVFVWEYRSDLRAWTGAVSKLMEKGYTRNEVLELLYQRPARSWHGLARKLPAKNPNVEVVINIDDIKPRPVYGPVEELSAAA